MTFDIRTHLDKFTPVEGKRHRYYCPVCRGNNLTMEPDSGAYQCWNGCQLADIRNAIAPLNQPKSTRPKSDRTWTYTDKDGTPIIRTRRIDDGQDNRKIWQEYFIVESWQAKSTPATKPLREAAKRALMPYNYAAVMGEIATIPSPTEQRFRLSRVAPYHGLPRAEFRKIFEPWQLEQSQGGKR